MKRIFKNLVSLAMLFLATTSTSLWALETEPNDSEAQANSINVSFTNNEGTGSIEASIQPENDTDYFKIELAAGKNYNLQLNASDSYNTNTYTCDVKFWYKINSGQYIGSYDSGIDDIIIKGPATVYIKSSTFNSPANAEDVGTYKMSCSVSETTNPLLKIDYSNITVDSRKDSVYSIVTSTDAWTLATPSSWITATKTSGGPGIDTVYFVIAENKSEYERNNNITVTAGSTDGIIYIYQSKFVAADVYEPNEDKSSATLMPALNFVDNKALFEISGTVNTIDDYDYYKVMLEKGYNYLIKTTVFDLNNPDGIQNFNGSIGITAIHNYDYTYNSHPLIVDAIAEKDSFYIRATEYVVGTYKIKISIERTTESIFEANITDFKFSKSSGYNSFIITSNVDWTVTSNQSWVTVSDLSGNGTSYISFNIDENTEDNARTATITLASTGLPSIVVNINQDGSIIVKDMYEPNDNESSAYTLTFPGSGTLLETTGATLNEFESDFYRVILPKKNKFIVHTELIDSYNDYNQINQYSADGKYKVKINSGEWSMYSDSQMEDIFANGGDTIIFKVIGYSSSDSGSYALQIKFSEIVFQTSSANISLASSSSSAEISVTSNQTWKIVYDNTWLTISPETGFGDATITLNATANTGNPIRTEVFQIISEGIDTIEITATQEGAKFLTISTEALNLSNGSQNTANFSISSNAPWSIESDQDWITLNTTSGSNNAEITVQASDNNSNTARTAQISVLSSNLETKVIIVTQAGKSISKIENATNSVVNIYPNPSNGIINISNLKLKNNIANISVYDLTGKVVLQESVLTENNVLSKNLNLTSGSYILSITGDNIVYKSKLVIK